LEKVLRMVFRSTLETRKDYSETELRMHVLMLTVMALTAGGHILFAVFFGMVGCVPLVVTHVSSLAGFAFVAYLIFHRRFDMAGILLSVLITASSLEAIYFVGGDNFSIFYQILVLLMALIIPYRNKGISIAIGVAMPLLMIASNAWNLLQTAPYDIGSYNKALSFLNIVVNSGCFAILLMLEKSVRQVIARFQQERISELETQANVDALTGLYNRRFGQAYLERLRMEAANESSCIAFCDLDDFKAINDRYGHDVGDRVLKAVAKELMLGMRKTDLACRWGGEEFLLVLPGMPLEKAHPLIDEMRWRVEQTAVNVGDEEVFVSMTIGLTVLDVWDIPGSLERCDSNMYAGKRTGKNRVVG